MSASAPARLPSAIPLLSLGQGLLLTGNAMLISVNGLAGFALAYVLRALIVPGFPRTLAFTTQETAVTFAVMLAGGVLASFMAIWHALRTPPQLALGG